jgi:preprotein translocase subunit SecG
MGFTVFLVLITVVCFLLIVVVMVQNPKGGGLSSTFGSSQQIGGVQKTTDFLDKSTWALGVILIGLILVSSLSFEGESSSKIIDASVTNPVKTEQSAPATSTESAPETTAPAESTEATE